MFSVNWQTSRRVHNIVVDRNVAIPVRDGITIDADIFRPAGNGTFPAILGVHGYSKADQLAALMPTAMSLERGHIEAGDVNFYVRRGYAQVIANIRGTGKSGGTFGYVNAESIQDVYDVIEWLARQPWCNGRVGNSKRIPSSTDSLSTPPPECSDTSDGATGSSST